MGCVACSARRRVGAKMGCMSDPEGLDTQLIRNYIPKTIMMDRVLDNEVAGPSG